MTELPIRLHALPGNVQIYRGAADVYRIPVFADDSESDADLTGCTAASSARDIASGTVVAFDTAIVGSDIEITITEEQSAALGGTIRWQCRIAKPSAGLSRVLLDVRHETESLI